VATLLLIIRVGYIRVGYIWVHKGKVCWYGSENRSFGNFLGHLPKELQVSARDEIKRELESLMLRRRPDDAPRQNTERGRIIAVATKP